MSERLERVVSALTGTPHFGSAMLIAEAHGLALAEVFSAPFGQHPRPKARAEIAHMLHAHGQTWTAIAEMFGVDGGSLRALCRRHHFLERKPANHDELLEQLASKDREILRLRRILAQIGRIAAEK